MNQGEEVTTKVDVLDFLIEILREHEKTLDDVVARLEKLAGRE